jgi:hypothetical protein
MEDTVHDDIPDDDAPAVGICSVCSGGMQQLSQMCDVCWADTCTEHMAVVFNAALTMRFHVCVTCVDRVEIYMVGPFTVIRLPQ